MCERKFGSVIYNILLFYSYLCNFINNHGIRHKMLKSLRFLPDDCKLLFFMCKTKVCKFICYYFVFILCLFILYLFNFSFFFFFTFIGTQSNKIRKTVKYSLLFVSGEKSIHRKTDVRVFTVIATQSALRRQTDVDFVE